MRLLVRALIVAALSSLVLTGVAIAAVRDASAAPYDSPPPGQVRIVSVLTRFPKAWMPADILILPPIDRMLVDAAMRSAVSRTGLTPTEYFPTNVANMIGSPVDVIVG